MRHTRRQPRGYTLRLPERAKPQPERNSTRKATAMSASTKLTEFFNSNRREFFLNSWEHLKSSAGESRIKLDISLPLLNKSVIAMPDAVSKAYGVMCEDSSQIASTKINAYLEGMTVQLFATDESKSPSVSATGATFQKLAVVAAGKGEKRTVDLNAVVYIPANVNVRDWAWEHLHGVAFLESVYSQSEMDFADEGRNSDDGPEVEDDEDEESDSEAEELNRAAVTGDVLDFEESDPEPAHVTAPVAAGTTDDDVPW